MYLSQIDLWSLRMCSGSLLAKGIDQGLVLSALIHSH